MQNRIVGFSTPVFAAATTLLSLLFLAAPQRLTAQDRPGDPMAASLVPGDYLRVGGGVTIPVNPQGSLRDWQSGPGLSLAYENWQAGDTGVGRVGFGLAVAYSQLALKEDQFAADFTPPTGTTASASGHARLLEITSNLRIRIPSPLVMPSLNIGLGFINWSPGTIHYTSTTGDVGTAKHASRSGAEVSLGGSLDRHIYGRVAAYVEAAYVYGYTSYGSGFGTPTSVCSSCDPLKNTTVATVRAGLRTRIGR